MQSCQKVPLDEAEAAQVRLYPLLLLNYSQFTLLGAVFLLVIIASQLVPVFAAGYVSGFTAFVFSLLWMLLVWGVAWAAIRFGGPFVIRVAVPYVASLLPTRKARWIAGGVAIIILMYLSDRRGFGVIFWVLLLLLPFAQSNVICRLQRWPMLAASIVSWAGIAIGVFGILLYASDLDRGRGELMVLILGLSPAFVWAWSLATRFLLISRISEQTRSLLRPHFRSVFSWEALRLFAGVPPVWNYLQSNKKPTLVLFLLSNLFGALAMIAILAFTTVGTRTIKVPEQALLLAFLIIVVVLAASVILMSVCDHVARSRTRISAKELIAHDTRAPILFLRAFADDQVALPAARLGPIGTILSLGRHRKSFDEMIMEEGTLYGPVVALGNPSDKVPPYGVARGYFQNAEWKKAVSDLARASALIVLCIDDTESVWWEVEHIFQNGYADKTLFVLPPKHRLADADKSLLPRLIQHLPSVPEATLRELVEACSRRDTLAVSIDPSGSVSIASSQTFSGFAYLMLLRWFLRARLPDTVAQTTFVPAREPAFAPAQATFAGATAGTANFSTAANPASSSTSAAAAPSVDASKEPAWIKIVRMTGAGMGLLGGLGAALIEGVYRLVLHLAPKVRDAAKDWNKSRSKDWGRDWAKDWKSKIHAAAQTSVATAAAGSARSADAWRSFDVGGRAQNVWSAIRGMPWPRWVTATNALAGGGVLLLLIGWVVLSRPSSTPAATTAFTPVPYTPPAARTTSSSPPTTVATLPSDPEDDYARRRDPNSVATSSSADACLTDMLNASLAQNDREKRRLNYLVVKDCTQAIRRNPRYAMGFLARGYAYKDLGQTPAAIADFRKALALDPTLPLVDSVLADLEDQQAARKKRRKY